MSLDYAVRHVHRVLRHTLALKTNAGRNSRYQRLIDCRTTAIFYLAACFSAVNRYSIFCFSAICFLPG